MDDGIRGIIWVGIPNKGKIFRILVLTVTGINFLHLLNGMNIKEEATARLENLENLLKGIAHLDFILQIANRV